MYLLTPFSSTANVLRELHPVDEHERIGAEDTSLGLAGLDG
jgi:hypothetical protein